jgi:hypothetical protein
LSPEFEAGKSPSAQSAPQIPFRVRLVTAKLAGGGDRVHPDRMQIVAKNSRRETPHPDPLPACEQFAGLVWLFSKSSSWMPEKHRNILIQGINERDQWARERIQHFHNPFLESLFSKKQKQFKLTKTVKQGLLQLVDAAKAELGITDSSDKIIKRILDVNIVNGFYTYQNWLKSKKK